MLHMLLPSLGTTEGPQVFPSVFAKISSVLANFLSVLANFSSVLAKISSVLANLSSVLAKFPSVLVGNYDCESRQHRYFQSKTSPLVVLILFRTYACAYTQEKLSV